MAIAPLRSGDLRLTERIRMGSNLGISVGEVSSNSPIVIADAAFVVTHSQSKHLMEVSPYSRLSDWHAVINAWVRECPL